MPFSVASMQRIEFLAFDTVVSVAASTADAATLGNCRDICVDLEHMLSRFEHSGPLCKLNHACGAVTELPDELAAFLQTALRYCADSKGCFDITMGAVCRLWDFHQGIVPDKATVEDALCHVDYRGLHIEGSSAWLDDEQACVDLGGIAKGYIADCLAQYLRSCGVVSALINLGGNILTVGAKPDGCPWRIGIRAPHSSCYGDEKPFAVIEVCDKSVVTSGTYERAFEKDGVSYHHILDRATGFPVQTDLLSATVVSDRSVDGDGYSTTLLVLGSKEALRFAQAHPQIEAALLTHDGKLLVTDGFPKVSLLAF